MNGWLAIPNVSTAEAMARQGWDSLTIDMQHGLADYQAALGMLTAIATSDAVPMARVPWLEEGIVMRMLDAGCFGVIAPMINRQEDAVRLVKACNYAPVGERSFGPVRVGLHEGPDYWRRANDEVLSIAMIETRGALDRLDEILDVDELSAVYVGPADLSLSLGCVPQFDQEEPVVVQAIEHIVSTARAKGKFVGVHNGTSAYARRMASLGAHFVTVASDFRFMMAGASAAVQAFRESDDASSQAGGGY